MFNFAIISGSHFLYEIVGIILSGKAEPLSHFKTKHFIELWSTMEQIEMQPPPRLMNTHIKLKYLPKKITENVSKKSITNSKQNIWQGY